MHYAFTLEDMSPFARGSVACRQAALSGCYSLIELDVRIWKNDLDAENGPDLLKNPDQIAFQLSQRN